MDTFPTVARRTPEMYGPETEHAQELHSTKYRRDDETYDDYCVRYARKTTDNPIHFRHMLDALRTQRILPAGRQQLAVGRPYNITAHNCFVGGTISDSSEGIMDELKNSMLTLRSGGGDGWDFSTLRPFGDPIRGLGLKAFATGPVSFMQCWDAMCNTVMSAGHRRGAMMGVIRVDHPDIMRFINAKANSNSLTNFNISVAVTDRFMEAMLNDLPFQLRFNGVVYDTVDPKAIWSRIMERNWDYAEPGVIFIDRVNQMNNLHYCEQIAATNPCGEQPLPPNGACLLASINVVKYLQRTRKNRDENISDMPWTLDLDLLRLDVAALQRSLDNVIDVSTYPLEAQKYEQQSKRRMGIGVTGMANALEVMGFVYGSPDYIEQQSCVLETIRDTAYFASISAAQEKGPFPLFNAKKYLQSGFAKTLPQEIRNEIRRKGIRNSHLLSIAPTGTISMCADNVSSGIEPPFALRSKRLVHMPDGQREIILEDYAVRKYGVEGRTSENTSAEDHIKVLVAAQKYVDSAVSKTCNVAGTIKGERTSSMQVDYQQFEQLYLDAYNGGAKGCTTFNINGKRFGIMTKADDEPSSESGDAAGGACMIDPATGIRTCDE